LEAGPDGGGGDASDAPTGDAPSETGSGDASATGD
jgi:hypothetical protein